MTIEAERLIEVEAIAIKALDDQALYQKALGLVNERGHQLRPPYAYEVLRRWRQAMGEAR